MNKRLFSSFIVHSKNYISLYKYNYSIHNFLIKSIEMKSPKKTYANQHMEDIVKSYLYKNIKVSSDGITDTMVIPIKFDLLASCGKIDKLSNDIALMYFNATLEIDYKSETDIGRMFEQIIKDEINLSIYHIID